MEQLLSDLGLDEALWRDFLATTKGAKLRRVAVCETDTWAGGIHDPLPAGFALTNTYALVGAEKHGAGPKKALVAKVIGDHNGTRVEAYFDEGGPLFVRRGAGVVEFMVQRMYPTALTATETHYRDGRPLGISAERRFNMGALLESALCAPEAAQPAQPAQSAQAQSDSEPEVLEGVAVESASGASDSEDEPLSRRAQRKRPLEQPPEPPQVAANASWRRRALAQSAASQR